MYDNKVSDVKIIQLLKRYGDVTAVDHVDLHIEAGSFTTLLGPSGCGKTTLLRLISGLELPTSGRIEIGDRIIYDSKQEKEIPPKERGLGMVFQSYALWPHMTVEQNIGYGPRVQNWPKERIKLRIKELLKSVEMEGYSKRYPSELSGGQQQRISVARTLALSPKLILFDEPLSNLDAKLRMSMRSEIKQIYQSTGSTCIYVTHDQTEAMSLSTHVAVMRDGKIQQVAHPREIYRYPFNIFVADFIGNPSYNLLQGEAQIKEGYIEKVHVNEEMVFEELHIPIKEEPTSNKVVIGFHPEDVVVESLTSPVEKNSFVFDVAAILDAGPDLYFDLRNKGIGVWARTQHDTAKLSSDKKIRVKVIPSLCNIFDAEREVNIRCKPDNIIPE